MQHPQYMRRIAAITAALALMVCAPASAQSGHSLSQRTLTTAIGRMAIQDIHDGDATGYWITKCGRDSCLLHESGSQFVTDNGSSVDVVATFRTWVRRVDADHVVAWWPGYLGRFVTKL